ncbi:RimK/LysX family protein [Oscillatoria sp. CS-180]|uniref:ATP-dependent zinc protease family protein n=1 Tax=Oscillatoria sp. CS-180 TaxID=3021720 RepID=UPI00232E9B99|nr:RimK/LysX family protein [Oscillatoria sp. CS-180]MDB9528631.1 RimK/LysX family protein [Oscillatoria sp. CS-180]
METTSDSVGSSDNLSVIGWREWVTLPQLGIHQIKAKVDTGARTSAIHAFDVDYFEENGCLMVHFKVHPLQRDTKLSIPVTASVLEKRQVRNSGGQAQERPVIQTSVALGTQVWPIELTLTNRDVMGFRMLLGREAVRRRFLVNPGSSYLLSAAPASESADEEIDEFNVL